MFITNGTLGAVGFSVTAVVQDIGFTKQRQYHPRNPNP